MIQILLYIKNNANKYNKNTNETEDYINIDKISLKNKI